MASAISKEIGKMIGFSRWPQRLKACPERSRRREVNLIRSAARLKSHALTRPARFRFLEGSRRIAFTAADVFLRRNGFYIEVEGLDAHAFVVGSMERREIPLCPNPRLDPSARQAPWFSLTP